MSWFKGCRSICQIILVILICFTCNTEAFSSVTWKETKSKTALSFGMPCRFKTSEFRPNESFSESDRGRVYDDAPTCKISQRLECVPVGYSNSYANGYVEGRCGCLRSLGPRAIFLTPEPAHRHFSSGCYIPAGFAYSSNCGHPVSLPFGMKQTEVNLTKPGDVNITLKWVPHTSVGNAREMCVPHSECRTSSKYIGTRCVCKRSAIWNHKDGTCAMTIYGEYESISSVIESVSFLVFLTQVVAVELTIAFIQHV